MKTFKVMVNEGLEEFKSDVKTISQFYGIRTSAMEDFFFDNNIDYKKVLSAVVKDKSSVDLVTVISGKLNNHIQKKFIMDFSKIK
jgi:hypothetical protein